MFSLLFCSGHFEGERVGMPFPLLSYGENAYILLKMHFVVHKDVFLTLKYGKTRWRTPLGELTTLPRPPSRLGGDTPPQTPSSSHPAQRLRRFDSRAFGASILGASNFALNFGVPILLLIYEMTTALLPIHCSCRSETVSYK